MVFAKEPPKQAVLTLQMGNDRFVIPPGDPNYRVLVSGTLPNDALLIGMFPHMHLRGKAFEYLITGPNGHVETLLKVNHYDFHWQLNYRLAEPRLLRAGTRSASGSDTSTIRPTIRAIPILRRRSASANKAGKR